MISRDADSILFVFVFMVMFKLRKVGHYGACGWRHLLLDTRCPIKENKKHSYTVSTRVFGNVRTYYPYVCIMLSETNFLQYNSSYHYQPINCRKSAKVGSLIQTFDNK